MGQSTVLSVLACSSVELQPAHCSVSLKNLTAASIFLCNHARALNVRVDLEKSVAALDGMKS
jgi:hypothetical protein